ncbi:MAG: nuclear transport factor 2 family protein [Bacteroidota bacterium]
MKSTIEEFYRAFQDLDAERMAACYHPDIVFEDPGFGVLKGKQASNMWRMLCANQKGKDFQVSYYKVHYADGKGSAHWEARYNFSQTGRRVHNIIQAEFKFEGDKIIDHRDHFDLYRWSRQALGTTGWLIGWTPFFRKKLQSQTHRLLEKFATKLES